MATGKVYCNILVLLKCCKYVASVIYTLLYTIVVIYCYVLTIVYVFDTNMYEYVYHMCNTYLYVRMYTDYSCQHGQVGLAVILERHDYHRVDGAWVRIMTLTHVYVY